MYKMVILFFLFSGHMVFNMDNPQESFIRDKRLDTDIHKRVFLRDRRFSLNIIRGLSRVVGDRDGSFFAGRTVFSCLIIDWTCENKRQSQWS